MATWVAPVLQSNRVAQARRASRALGFHRRTSALAGSSSCTWVKRVSGPSRFPVLQDLAGRCDLGLAQRIERMPAVLGEPGRFRAGHDAVPLSDAER